MGLFSSSANSRTESNIDQQDRRQLADGGSVNQQAGSVSSFASNGGISFVNRVSDGSNVNSTLIFENLNADLAALAIEETTASVKNTLTEGLGFADTQIDKVLKLAADTQTAAGNQLEETRDFAAGLIDRVSTSADERLESLSKGAFLTLAALAGLLVWRAF